MGFPLEIPPGGTRLDWGGRLEWTRREVREVLATHTLFEPVEMILPHGMDQAEFDALLQRSMEGDDDATKHLMRINEARLVAGVEASGRRHVEEFVCRKVFDGADEDERSVFEKFLLPSPELGPLVVKAVKPFAEPGKEVKDWQRRYEAIDAAYRIPRLRRLGVWINPFIQRDALDQKGLGRFVAAKMSGSTAEAVGAMVGMRRYAMDKGALHDFVKDVPADISRYYCNTILEDLKEESIPATLHQAVIRMLVRGQSREHIVEVVRAMSSPNNQTLPPHDFVSGGIRFSVLGKHDPFVLNAGEINGSCMTWGGAAGSCVEDIIVNPRSALLVAKVDGAEASERPATFREALDAEIRKGAMSLEAQGYLMHSYVRIAADGTLCLDNVEANESGRENHALAKALHAWIMHAMAMVSSKRALVGIAYSPPGMLDDMCGRVELSPVFMTTAFPGTNVYTDLARCGAWEVSIPQTAV